MNSGDTHLEGVVRGPIVEIRVHTGTPEAVFSYAAGRGQVEISGSDGRRVEERA